MAGSARTAARVRYGRLKPGPTFVHAVLFPLISACVLQEGPKGHRCLCPPGFTGVHCEVRRNACASRPCQNGGQCHAEAEGFVCRCPPKFSGQLCEVRPDCHPGGSSGVLEPRRGQSTYQSQASLVGARWKKSWTHGFALRGLQWVLGWTSALQS